MITTGLRHTSRLLVTEGDTAIARGSGNLPVLATPAMMALMENAAMLAVANYLPEGCTTVGGQICATHLKPTPVGETVTATATVTRVDGKKIEFRVEAYCYDTLLGEGTHLRYIVDKEKFMSRL
ncbi:MAG: thioesterase family protein [Muribaculaceae bacterium]|nr:thioesterase family protein [Muribaculaceae bacterium]